MSASLVGSEMCIRDRLLGEALGRGRRPPPEPHRGGGEVLRDRTPEELPVSYTHLTLPTICSV
eukprot:5988688-Alexandrium_andersonii.AAC.1